MKKLDKFLIKSFNIFISKLSSFVECRLYID